MNTITYKRRKGRKVDIVFKGITQGKALALCNALATYAQHSVVADDIRLMLFAAIQRSNSLVARDDDQMLFDALESLRPC